MLDFYGVYAMLPRLLAAAGVTLSVSIAGFALGTIIALALILMARSRLAPARWIVAVYTSFIRGTPLLVQVLVIYYALPGLVGLDLSPLAAGILALAFNSAAFIVEILRAGLSRIPAGQFEACRALALPRMTMAFRVILPQLIRNIVPPMVSEFTMLVKASAILSVITVIELTRTGQQIMNETFRPVEAFSAVAIIYFVILFTFSMLSRRLEHKTARGSH